MVFKMSELNDANLIDQVPFNDINAVKRNVNFVNSTQI